MDGFKFVVLGEPVAQPRPRATSIGGMARMYEAAKDHPIHAYKDAVALYCRQAMQADPLTGPVRVHLLFCHELPKTYHRKRNPPKEQWKATKPDLDNLTKAVLDALNGVAWQDDSQVVWLNSQKVTAAQGHEPYTEVLISELHQPEPIKS